MNRARKIPDLSNNQIDRARYLIETLGWSETRIAVELDTDRNTIAKYKQNGVLPISPWQERKRDIDKNEKW